MKDLERSDVAGASGNVQWCSIFPQQKKENLGSDYSSFIRPIILTLSKGY